MAAHRLIDLYQRRQIRRERIFRDRLNPLDSLNDLKLYNRYRFDRPSILWISDLLRPDLEHPTKRGQSLPVSMQVMMALRYYASGTFIIFQNINLLAMHF